MSRRKSAEAGPKLVEFVKPMEEFDPTGASGKLAVVGEDRMPNKIATPDKPVC